MMSFSSQMNIAGGVMSAVNIITYIAVLSSLWDGITVDNKRLSVLSARTALFFPTYTAIMLISLLAPAG